MNDKDRRIAELEQENRRLLRYVEFLEYELEYEERPPAEKPKKIRRKDSRKRIPVEPGEHERRRAFILGFRTACVDCGEPDTRIRDPSTKRGTVSTMQGERWSYEDIQAEIEKCDCLCPTCHRKRHLK